MTTSLPALDFTRRRAGTKKVTAAAKPNAKTSTQKEPVPPVLAFRLWHELGEVQAPDRLVHRLLGESSLACIYGKSGCGKSFLALDLALHLALGREWFGRRVTQRPTLYIAAEGQLGACNRVAAFRKRHGLDIDSDVAFALLPEPLDLFDPTAAVDWVIEQMKFAAEKFGGIAPGLLVIDTLARCFGRGDESNTPDMSAFIANMDKIRKATGATILMVHHTGKDTARGERGSYALRAAVDTSIEVSGLSGTRVITIKKQKDGQDGAAFAFTLESEEVGADDEGDVITSCVVAPSDEMPAGAAGKGPRLTPQTKIILDALRESIDREGTPAPASNHIPKGRTLTNVRTWRENFDSREGANTTPAQKRMAFRRGLERLQAAEIIGIWQDQVWIC